MHRMTELLIDPHFNSIPGSASALHRRRERQIENAKMVNYRTIPQDEENREDDGSPLAGTPMVKSFSFEKVSSFHSSLSPLLTSNKQGLIPPPPLQLPSSKRSADTNSRPANVTRNSKSSVLYIVIYGIVNSIMAIPCVFGYATVIFNNPAFSPHINELSKVVLWSSVVHQFAFTAFSSLPFAIGQVQDAGLIFLSHMSNTMANKIVDDGGTTEEAVSTCLVILSMATFSTGIVLMLMGKFRLADLVSYLPLPVVGGYLACKFLRRCLAGAVN